MSKSYLDHFGLGDWKNLQLSPFVVILQVQMELTAIPQRTLQNASPKMLLAGAEPKGGLTIQPNTNY